MITVCPNCGFTTSSQILLRWHSCEHERNRRTELEADELLEKVLEHDEGRILR